MSALIKLSDGCWIDPDDVCEVKVNDLARTIVVRMRNGVGHNVGEDYGAGVYTTADKLIERINAARTVEATKP